jgi:hypothetical protein
VVVAEGVPSPQSSALHKVAEDPIESMRRALSPGASAEGTGDGRHVIRRSGVVSEVVASELQGRCAGSREICGLLPRMLPRRMSGVVSVVR